MNQNAEMTFVKLFLKYNFPGNTSVYLKKLCYEKLMEAISKIISSHNVQSNKYVGQIEQIQCIFDKWTKHFQQTDKHKTKLIGLYFSSDLVF